MIKEIKINEFRCLKNISLKPHKRLNIFTGKDGSGKSTVLEWLILNNKMLLFFNGKGKGYKEKEMNANSVSLIEKIFGIDNCNITSDAVAYVRDLSMSITNVSWLQPTGNSLSVLIDDIGCLLHPDSQMRLLPSLLEVFLEYQFIVTTTSDHIIRSVDDCVVYDLDDKTANEKK